MYSAVRFIAYGRACLSCASGCRSVVVTCTAEREYCEEMRLHLCEHFSSMRVLSVGATDTVALMRALRSAAAFVCVGRQCPVEYAALLPRHSALVISGRAPIRPADIGRLDLTFLWVASTVECAGLVAELDSCEVLTHPWMVSVRGSNRSRPCELFVLGNTVQAALEETVGARAKSDPCNTLDLMCVKQVRYTLHDTHYLLVPWLLRTLSITSLLEIGCQTDALHKAIVAHGILNLDYVGVDPIEGGNRRMTSDAFFAGNNRTFGLVFIDGAHAAHQVHRDIENALRWLEPNGIILLHDCFPISRLWNDFAYSGDGWKALLAHRLRAEATGSPLDVAVGNFDFGVGAILRRVPLRRENGLREMSADTRAALLTEPPSFGDVGYRRLETASQAGSDWMNLKNIPAFVRFLLGIG